MVNLNDMAKQAHMLAKQRGLETDVFSCLKHCAGEVTEAVEANSKVWDDIRTYGYLKHLEEELADVIICVLTASADMQIDIEKAISESMQKNAGRAYGTAEA